MILKSTKCTATFKTHRNFRDRSPGEASRFNTHRDFQKLQIMSELFVSLRVHVRNDWNRFRTHHQTKTLFCKLASKLARYTIRQYVQLVIRLFLGRRNRQLATPSVVRRNAHHGTSRRRLVYQSRLSISIEVERVYQREQFDVLQDFTAAQTSAGRGLAYLVPGVRHRKYTELLNEIRRVFSCFTVLRLPIVCVAFNLSVHSISRCGNELLTIHGRRQMTERSWPRNLKSLGCHDCSAETTRVCALLEICERAEFRGLRQQRN